jgi:hypothetical protein
MQKYSKSEPHLVRFSRTPFLQNLNNLKANWFGKGGHLVTTVLKINITIHTLLHHRPILLANQMAELLYPILVSQIDSVHAGFLFRAL